MEMDIDAASVFTWENESVCHDYFGFSYSQ